ncbi:MAG: hypothetical protein SPJ59_04340 [Peptoniphilaceae bacterium]|nr:hypothetical protein [Peptoniphilaceae bacterium]
MDTMNGALSDSMGFPIQTSALSHAYLLEGDETKAVAFARRLAKRVLCDFGGAQVQRFEDGNCPDLEIVPEETISIDRIRELTASMYRSPIESRYRVYLLEHAGNLREDAQNALLKSLEEPPGYLVWILVTSNRAKLLPTIRSRVRILSCPRTEQRTSGSEEEALLPWIEKALAGRGKEVFSQNRIFDPWKERKKEILLYIEQYLGLLLHFKILSCNMDNVAPEIRYSVMRMSPQVSTEQVARALNETEQIRQLMDVHVNFQLAMEHLFLRGFAESGERKDDK